MPHAAAPALNLRQQLRVTAQGTEQTDVPGRRRQVEGTAQPLELRAHVPAQMAR
jgi:hypothetical protein